jgi:hypothetical protein
MAFFLKVIRNGIILASYMFIAIWATTDNLNWVFLKPVVLFLMGYILTELMRYYKLSYPAATTKGKKACISPLVF